MSGVPPPQPSSHISRLPFFFFLLLLLLPTAVTSAGLTIRNTSIPQCPVVDCGDGVEIRYPLGRSSGPDTPYCGYSSLGIECLNGHPIVKLGNTSYRVDSVNYGTSTLTLKDMEVLVSDCPRPRHNLTLERDIYLSETDADTNLFFFFNCSSNDTLSSPDLPCLRVSSSGNRSYVFSDGTIPPLFSNWWVFCQERVVATVLKSEVPSNASKLWSSFGEILHQGFQLTWQLPAEMTVCNSCERTGGMCGEVYDYDDQKKDFRCFCSNGTQAQNCRGVPDGVVYTTTTPRGLTEGARRTIIGIAAAASGFLVSLIIFYYWRKANHHQTKSFWNRKSENTKNVEAFLEQYGSLVPKRYRYADIKKMTKSFGEKLGQGGYGVVFKGKFPDGRLVAIKVLNKSEGSGKEFMNEVASIGRTHHVNIVSLLGFCYEGSKRALIYEFMHNGSLDKFIFPKGQRDMTPLGWDKLFKIAIGIARGLEYLHRGCNTQIVHFDIKPHNILLDEDFCPKISDFGLAKSCQPKQSILSIADARGTIGYIAPEVFSRNFGEVTSKSDVYSYGMMVLEMVGGRRNTDERICNTSEVYFPHWIYEHFDDGDFLKSYGVTSENEEISRKMILVGLWCIQTNPICRPSTSEVVEMLEGNLVELQMPPKPCLSSPSRSNSNFPTQTISLLL